MVIFYGSTLVSQLFEHPTLDVVKIRKIKNYLIRFVTSKWTDIC
jgi:hypothetical protein